MKKYLMLLMSLIFVLGSILCSQVFAYIGDSTLISNHEKCLWGSLGIGIPRYNSRELGEFLIDCNHNLVFKQPNSESDGFLDGRLIISNEPLTFAVSSFDGMYNESSPLTKVILPRDTSKLCYSAFGFNPELTYVYIPESVTEIDKDAFKSSPNVKIYGIKGSYAETFANSVNISFVEEKSPYPYGITLKTNLEMSTEEYKANSVYPTPQDAANILEYVINGNTSLMSYTYGNYITEKNADYNDYLKWIDVDCDGKITSADAAHVMQKAQDNSYLMPCER